MTLAPEKRVTSERILTDERLDEIEMNATRWSWHYYEGDDDSDARKDMFALIDEVRRLKRLIGTYR